LLPDAKSFASFEKALLRRGFRRLSEAEFRSDFIRLRLQAPSPREGREVGFSFAANGLEVVVWTTFLARAGRAREEDAGWVLIKDGDDVRYFSHPLHRTQNFLHNLLWTACIARWKVEHRPLCPQCGALMKIAYGKGLKARYWGCTRTTVHKNPTFLSWDHGLPREALDFLEPRRKRRAQYHAKLRKEGKSPGAGIQRRRKWKVGRPANIVPSR
jgi:hypothetical protein